MRGAIFENWTIMEYVKQYNSKVKEPEIYFWRDNTGNEIDLLAEDNTKLFAYEIKSGMTINPNSYKGLNYWKKLTGSPDDQLAVIYGGDISMETKFGKLIGWRDWGEDRGFGDSVTRVLREKSCHPKASELKSQHGVIPAQAGIALGTTVVSKSAFSATTATSKRAPCKSTARTSTRSPPARE